MKRSSTTLILILVFIIVNPLKTYAQCAMTPLTLENKVTNATQIVDAKVIKKECFKNKENFIFTKYTLEVKNSYKGRNPSNIYVISEGGIVGLEMIKVNPNIELEEGEFGLFFLIKSKHSIPTRQRNILNYETYALNQGFVKYDIENQSATDHFNIYPNISIDLIEKIMVLTQDNIKYNIPQNTRWSRRATPTISKFAPTSISAGTEQILTITGTNFGVQQGNGKVGFKYGNDGGKTWFYPISTEYVSWSNTQIKVKVPAYAGTGTIRVIENGKASVTSSQQLTVRFAHSNATYKDSKGVTRKYQTQMVDLNGSGGIDWKINRQFYDSTAALKAFVRSLETWRCGSYINWDTAGKTNSTAIKNDAESIVVWDTKNTMPSGVLGRCYSYYGGCSKKGGGFNWYVKGLDIIFKHNYSKWNYGPKLSSGGKLDFESVATHELGHGTQMLHVINTNDVMHFSIGPNRNKRTLSAYMLEGGKHVMTRSKTAVCSKKIIKPLDSSSCTYPTTIVNFTVTKKDPCIDETVTFKSKSTGNFTKYDWNFGLYAIPMTAIGKGPHSVKYSQGGSKDVKLTATTKYGEHHNKITNFVNVKKAKFVTADFNFKDLGAATVQFTNLSVNQASQQWAFGDTKTSTDLDPKNTYSAKKLYTVKLTSTNACNSASKSKVVKVTSEPIKINISASSQTICLDDNVVFTDKSTGIITAYKWNFGANAIPSTASKKGPHTVKYSTGGVKNISLTATSAAGKETIDFKGYITVKADKHAKADFSYINKNSVVDFTNKSTNGKKYLWNFGDTKTSIDENPTHQYATAKTYKVKLTTTNTCNSHDTTINVIVTSKSTIADFDVNKTKICKNESVIFKDYSVGPVVSYAWNFGLGANPKTAIGKGPHTVKYTTGGTKTVVLTLQTPTGEKKKTKTSIVDVNSDNRPIFDAKWEHWGKNYYKFIDNSKFNTSLKWDFVGEGKTSTDKSLMMQLTKSPYKVIHTISNKCDNVETVFNLGDKVGLEEVNIEKVSIYPNPATNYLTIKPINNTIVKLSIIDILGKTVFELNKKLVSETQIPLNLTEGNYFVKVEFDNETISVKKLTIKP